MRLSPTILSAAVASLLIGCSDSTGPSDPPALQAPPSPKGVSFTVAPAAATLQQGQTRQFTTAFAGNPGLSTGPVSVTWQSSNEAVASVTPTGLVRGVSGGEARIVANLGGYQATAVVTVTGPWKKHQEPTVCLKRIPGAERQLTTEC